MGYDFKKGDRPRFVNGGTTLFEHRPSLKSRSVPLFKLFLLKKYKLEQSGDEKGLINTNWSSQKLCSYLKIQTGAD